MIPGAQVERDLKYGSDAGMITHNQIDHKGVSVFSTDVTKPIENIQIHIGKDLRSTTRTTEVVWYSKAGREEAGGEDRAERAAAVLLGSSCISKV